MENTPLSDDERRVLQLCRLETCKLSLDDARILVRLCLRGCDFQDAIKGNPELRSGLLKRQATKQSSIPRMVLKPAFKTTYDPKAPPGKRLQPPSIKPQLRENTSKVDLREIDLLLKAAKMRDDPDAETALRLLADDLTAAGRKVPKKLAEFVQQPMQLRNKRGPKSRRMLEVLLFELLVELKKRGINPTRDPQQRKWECGASIIADEGRTHDAHLTEGAVVKIWNFGISRTRISSNSES